MTSDTAGTGGWRSQTTVYVECYPFTDIVEVLDALCEHFYSQEHTQTIVSAHGQVGEIGWPEGDDGTDPPSADAALLETADVIVAKGIAHMVFRIRAADEIVFDDGPSKEPRRDPAPAASVRRGTDKENRDE